ncbi:MAG: ribosome maturation factor RimM [Desulfocapsaceae bacterium]|nr:ribosome maturation factor RimM [Desulfocapsaceae bacterium]
MAVHFVFPEEQFILVGTVAKPHGLHGELKLNSFSAEDEAFVGHERYVLVDDRGRLSEPLTVERHRRQGKTTVVKLQGIDSRDSAEEYFGKGLLVYKSDLPALGENEYYWYQFVGLEVKTTAETSIGTIQAIFNNGAHDIMVIRNQQQELLIPIIEGVIKEHNEKGVVITPPPGLLELYNGDDK